MNLNDLADAASQVVEGGSEDTSDLEWYLVGGAVRDALLGQIPQDFDFVVVGEDRGSIQDRGFQLIDNDGTNTFPVFVNSEGEEFALARTEVLTNDEDGNPHKAVDVEIENVTLEDDLRRRDFTINAMALSPDGELIDPFAGKWDLEEPRQIMHVSEAFKEDPLRVLRGARFAARIGGARVPPATKELMANVAPEIPSLPGERLRIEMVKTFKQSENPRVFFDTLAGIGDDATPSALDVSFPEVARLQQIPAGPEQYHEEGSAYEHTMRVMQEMAALRPNDEIAQLMALAHDLGKQNTPVEDWPHHNGHAGAAMPIVDQLNGRLRFSNDQVRAMKDAARHHMKMKHIEEMRAASVFDLVQATRFEQRLIDLAVADARGAEPQREFPRGIAEQRFDAVDQATSEVNGSLLIEEGVDPDEIGGELFGKRIRDRRIEKIQEIEYHD